MNKVSGWVGSLPANMFSGFVVSLIALPLGLGLAIASGMPPISGIIAAVVGGAVVAIMGGSHLTITGPGNGLVVVLLGAVYTLGDGDLTQGYLFTLAAIICSGGLLLLFGFLRLGGLSEFFPASAIQGMLAAIGLTILIKQLFVMVGDMGAQGDFFSLATQVPDAISAPFGAHKDTRLAGSLVGWISLAIMVGYSRIRARVFHLVPAPMWVVLFAVGLSYYYELFSVSPYPIANELMIQIPENLFGALPRPDFALLTTVPFWGVVFSITLIASIESLLSIKAVDKLDPEKRRSNTNRDLKALGLATIISGFLGGMNVVTVIARSSVNVNNNATNRSSNFFHALFLFLAVLVFQDQIRRIPLPALAAILVYTGYKLASPDTLKKVYTVGREQLIIFLVTLLTTLFTNLITGIFVGVLITFLTHIIINRSLLGFIRNVSKPNVLMFMEPESKGYFISVAHFCSFLNFFKLKSKLDMVPQNKRLVVDFSLCGFVDHSVMENLSNYQSLFERKGGSFELVGLDVHQADSGHPFAIRKLLPLQKIGFINRFLTRRQENLKAICERQNWSYQAIGEQKEVAVNKHLYFKNKQIKRVYNMCSSDSSDFRVFDVDFSEGEFIAKEDIRATVMLISVGKEIPQFRLDKEGLIEKIYHLAGYDDIDLIDHPKFSSRFYLKGENADAIREFFSDDLVDFLEKNITYHIESNGKEVLIIHHQRLASVPELEQMMQFGKTFKYTGKI